MADETNGKGAQGDPGTNAQPDQGGVTPPATPGDPAASGTASDPNGELLRALKVERDARQQAERELKKRDTEIEKQKTAQLEKAGEYKKLYEEASAKVELAQVSVERVAQLEGAIEASNQLRIESIPETMRGLVPEHYTPEQKAAWLDENAAHLSLPGSPNLNAGAGASVPSRRNGGLTAAELEAARRYGVSPEEALRTKQLMAGAPIETGDFGPEAPQVAGMVQPPNVLGVQGIVNRNPQSQQGSQVVQPKPMVDNLSPHSEPRGRA